MADAGRGADRHQPNLGHGGIELAGGLEHRQAIVAEAARRDGGGQLEILGAVDRGQVLVDSDLAHTNHGDLAFGHAAAPRRKSGV
ncbi:hypothetical protein D9M68_984490 [compost metagenome]